MGYFLSYQLLFTSKSRPHSIPCWSTVILISDKRKRDLHCPPLSPLFFSKRMIFTFRDNRDSADVLLFWENGLLQWLRPQISFSSELNLLWTSSEICFVFFLNFYKDGQGNILDEQGNEAMDFEEEVDPYIIDTLLTVRIPRFS